MKILQIAVATDNEGSECLYAVADDGEVYAFQYGHAPYERGQYSKQFVDGNSGGWYPLNKDNKINSSIPNPNRPAQ